jgi:hypothetical protein
MKPMSLADLIAWLDNLSKSGIGDPIVMIVNPVNKKQALTEGNIDSLMGYNPDSFYFEIMGNSYGH